MVIFDYCRIGLSILIHRKEAEIDLDRLRLSSIFAIFLLIAPRLIGGKILKEQILQTAAGYSPFE